MPNIAAQVISEIRDEATEHNVFVDDYDSGDRVRENFQAPFYASANVPSKVTEGWAIAAPVTHSHFETNQIDRIDKNPEPPIMIDTAPRVEATTKKFDPETFKPEFLTGFQPIVHSADPSRQPPVLPTVSSRETSVAPRKPVSSTPATSPKADKPPTDKPTGSGNKKPLRPFDSLEAFFDALTRDYDAPDDDYQTTSRNS